MNRDRIKFVGVSLISITFIAWIIYLLLIYRQLYLFKTANPMSDTGLSFGYAALTKFGGTLMAGFSLASIATGVWLSKSLNSLRLHQR
jgi:hypothetical protein